MSGAELIGPPGKVARGLGMGEPAPRPKEPAYPVEPSLAFAPAPGRLDAGVSHIWGLCLSLGAARTWGGWQQGEASGDESRPRSCVE
jgi:hypothetical protein